MSDKRQVRLEMSSGDLLDMLQALREAAGGSAPVVVAGLRVSDIHLDPDDDTYVIIEGTPE